MQNHHDPYLETAARSINNKLIKNRKKKVKAFQKEQKTGFYNQEISIEGYLTFNKPILSMFISSIILFLPYLIGLFAMLIIFNLEVISYYTQISIPSFLFSWLIGYEVIAFSLLLIIFKNAYLFSKK